MCTTKEWFNTHGTQQPLPQGKAAWVQPDLVAVVYRNDTQTVQYMDWTGTVTSTNNVPYTSLANCSQWTSADPLRSGKMVSNEPVTSRDIIRNQTCSVANYVTCCTPAQVTTDFSR